VHRAGAKSGLFSSNKKLLLSLFAFLAYLPICLFAFLPFCLLPFAYFLLLIVFSV